MLQIHDRACHSRSRLALLSCRLTSATSKMLYADDQAPARYLIRIEVIILPPPARYLIRIQVIILPPPKSALIP